MNREQAKEAIKVMQAYVDGETIECNIKHYEPVRWSIVGNPCWNFDSLKYRIAKETPDEVDWSHISDEFNWMARHEDNRASLFRSRPVRVDDVGFWLIPSRLTSGASANHLKSYKRGTVDWKVSLVMRPGYQGD